MEDQVDRLIYLLEELGRQAEERLMTYPMHHSSTVHLILGKLFNDYVSQLRESSGEGLVSILDEVAIPDDDAGVEAMVSEIALRARQIAAELRYQEWQAAEGDEEGREDWADALIRLAEAGVDTDDLINSTDVLMAGRGVDRAWVDRIVKLACAGIDVDDLITNLAYRRPPQGPFHRHPRALARRVDRGFRGGTHRDLCRRRPAGNARLQGRRPRRDKRRSGGGEVGRGPGVAG